MIAEGAASIAEASPGAEWLSAEAARAGAGAAAEGGDRLSSGEAATGVGVFELLDRDLLESATSATRNAPRPPPLAQEEWLSFLNPEGTPLMQSASPPEHHHVDASCSWQNPARGICALSFANRIVRNCSCEHLIRHGVLRHPHARDEGRREEALC